ncbi:HAD family hydrolase [Marisediminicola sp. LYQ85]|uniref:HAD family hydrolase n=1 Tax=Marisediminicola sp. LYQ85 TaxID=3391062 RepID=UPI0039838A10
MGAFRGVGFDLDGTLFDHRGSAAAGLSAFLRVLNVEPTPAAHRAWFAAEDEQFERWRSGQISFAEQRRERLRTVLAFLGLTPPNDPSQLDELFEVFLDAYRVEWRAFPGSLDLLNDLHASGYRVGLLTNGIEEQQLDKLRHTGLADAFDVVCVSENIGAQKPDPRAFRALADGLGLTPPECLFVGDSVAHDVEGARAAGMGALLVNRYARDATSITKDVYTGLART